MIALPGAALVSLIVALAVTPLLRAFSARLGLLDVPNVRSSHVLPTPRGGGIAILAGIAAAVLAWKALQDRALMACLLGASVIAILGLIDDVRNSRAWPKFVIHIAVAAAAVLIGGLTTYVIALPFVAVPLGLLALPFSILWIVGWINAYNFMDGVNGIAGLQALIAGVAMAALFWRHGDVGGAVVAIALAGGAAGFLPWNFPKARIFMGDVGSATLGFLFAVLVLRATPRVGIIAATLPLFPFLFDSSVTVVRRALRGERFFSTPHRSHFYQRLMELTGSHSAVTLTWGGLAVVSSIGGLAYVRANEGARLGIVALIIALHVAVAAAVTWREKIVARRLA